MDHPTPSRTLNGRNLEHRWWTVPLQMTAAITFTFFVIALVATPRTSFPWYLIVGAFFGLVGLGHARGYRLNTRAAMESDGAVSWCGPTHPLTVRTHALCARLGMPPVRVGIFPSVNAYAVKTDRTDATVVIGAPLIQQLSTEELDAVIGHELGHLVTNDSDRMLFASGYQEMLRSAVSNFASALTRQFAGSSASRMLGHALGDLVANILFCIGELIKKAISRRREYVADAIGAALTHPDAMIGALERIHGIPRSNSAIERTYGYLMFSSLGSTHPSLEERRAALQKGDTVRSILAAAAPDGTSQPFVSAAAPPPAAPPIPAKDFAPQASPQGGAHVGSRKDTARPAPSRPLPRRVAKRARAPLPASVIAGGLVLVVGASAGATLWWMSEDPVDTSAIAARLAARPTGDLACWGGGLRQLRALPPAGTYVDYSVNEVAICGIEQSKGLGCWITPLGADSAPAASALAIYPQGLRARAVALGPDYGLVINDGGRVRSWGRPSPAATLPPRLADETFIEVRAGRRIACGLTERMGLACWGEPHDVDTISAALPRRNVGAFDIGPTDLCWWDPTGGAQCVHLSTGARATIPVAGPARGFRFSENELCALGANDTMSCVRGSSPRTFTNLKDISYHDETCGVRADHSVRCVFHQRIKDIEKYTFASHVTLPKGLRLQNIKASSIACGMRKT